MHGESHEGRNIASNEVRRLLPSGEDLGSREVPAKTWYHNNLLTEIFGEEWVHMLQDAVVEENHDYIIWRFFAVRFAYEYTNAASGAEPSCKGWLAVSRKGV